MPFGGVTIFGVVAGHHFIEDGAICAVRPTKTTTTFLFFGPTSALGVVFVLVNRLCAITFTLYLRRVRGNCALFTQVVLKTGGVSTLQGVTSTMVGNIFTNS